MICSLCPRNCGIDRNTNVGYCSVGSTLKIAKIMIHNWEEPLISGSKGSGTIFFSGCSLKCVYCQNYSISRGKGKEYTVSELVSIFKHFESLGVHNINLVSASHYIPEIKKVLDIYKPNLPIVFNCSGYEKEDTIKSLHGYVDIFLPDFKYAISDVAKRYSNAPDYFDVACNAIKTMREVVDNDIIDNGLMKKGMIVRHLVLPTNIDNSLQVLDYFSKHLPKDTHISIMGQYLPCGEAKNFNEINRKLKPLEYKIIVNKIASLGFSNVLIQDLSSANDCFIPDFD